jgi:pyrroloquinoline quinone biosynthesis protein B
MAFSADNLSWVVIGASPDLRQQIIASPALHPKAAPRHSPIQAMVLVSADIDGIAGLLTTRESQPLRIYAPADLLAILAANPVFNVLDPALVERIALPLETWTDCGQGLWLRLLTMPGKIPLYLENRAATEAEPGPVYAAEVRAGGRSVIYAPACARITDAVRDRLASADAVFFDGTVFTDDEMPRAGVSRKTGVRMGHVSMAGPEGSLARLSDLPGRRIYIHINNTNPVLIAHSPEHRAVTEAGFEVAWDGMEIRV